MFSRQTVDTPGPMWWSSAIGSVWRLSSGKKSRDLQSQTIAKFDSYIQIQTIHICVPDSAQNRSILRISSSFLFNIGMFRHFNTVNNSNTMEAGHMRVLDTCSYWSICREVSVSSIRQQSRPQLGYLLQSAKFDPL